MNSNPTYLDATEDSGEHTYASMTTDKPSLGYHHSESKPEDMAEQDNRATRCSRPTAWLVGLSVVVLIIAGLLIVDITMTVQLQNDFRAQTSADMVELKDASTPPTTTMADATEEYSIGSTYIRWGRTTCSNSSQLLYEGLASGQYSVHKGGASNYLCLPSVPDDGVTVAGNFGNYISGAEYKTGGYIFDPPMYNQNVPCAACYTEGRSTTIMIPAVRNCPNTWKKEYEGYLMSGQRNQEAAYNYVCVDKSPEAIAGGHLSGSGAFFYQVQIDCSNLIRCPPYVQGTVLTCVVCSK